MIYINYFCGIIKCIISFTRYFTTYNLKFISSRKITNIL